VWAGVTNWCRSRFSSGEVVVHRHLIVRGAMRSDPMAGRIVMRPHPMRAGTTAAVGSPGWGRWWRHGGASDRAQGASGGSTDRSTSVAGCGTANQGTGACADQSAANRALTGVVGVQAAKATVIATMNGAISVLFIGFPPAVGTNSERPIAEYDPIRPAH